MPSNFDVRLEALISEPLVRLPWVDEFIDIDLVIATTEEIRVAFDYAVSTALSMCYEGPYHELLPSGHSGYRHSSPAVQYGGEDSPHALRIDIIESIDQIEKVVRACLIERMHYEGNVYDREIPLAEIRRSEIINAARTDSEQRNLRQDLDGIAGVVHFVDANRPR